MNRDLLRDGVVVLVRVRDRDREDDREDDGRLEGVRVKLLRDGVVVKYAVGVTGINVLV